MSIDRSHWMDHVKRVVRSRHYTWLPEGLGGEDVQSAMAYLTADIMHVCGLSGIDWQEVLKHAEQQFETEELPLIQSHKVSTPAEQLEVT